MFTGFTQDAVDFLTDIRFNNNQTFYEANKERYEKHVKAPLRALSEEMAPVVQLIDPRLDTRPGRTMSRCVSGKRAVAPVFAQWRMRNFLPHRSSTVEMTLQNSSN